MDDKYDLAGYLVNLHTLMEAQEKTGALTKSKVLVDEYNRAWAQLKEAIESDEAGKSAYEAERTRANESGSPRR